MDRDSIAAELAKPLDSKLVKPPPQGKYGEYVPAFDIITTANRIFGWDGWSYTVDKLEVTNAGPGTKEGSHAIGYLAVVAVTVGNTRKSDVGHGQGHGRSLGDAHDSAAKEAVTDALKRALRTFGHPLGLALYDKTKAHVSDDTDAADRDPKEAAERLLFALKHTADGDLKSWANTNTDTLKWLRITARDQYDRVSQECKDRAARISREEAA